MGLGPPRGAFPFPFPFPPGIVLSVAAVEQQHRVQSVDGMHRPPMTVAQKSGLLHVPP